MRYTPAEDRAIGAERHTERASCRDRDDAATAAETNHLRGREAIGRWTTIADLAHGVVTPGEHGAIGLERHTERASCRDRDDATARSEADDLDRCAGIGWCLAVAELAGFVVAPGVYRAVGSCGKTERAAGGNSGHPGQPRDLNGAGAAGTAAVTELAGSVVTPSDDCAVAADGETMDLPS